MKLFSIFEFDQAASEPAQPEVAGAFDAFVSLEDIAPDLDWSEALADAWGIPTVSESD